MLGIMDNSQRTPLRSGQLAASRRPVARPPPLDHAPPSAHLLTS